MNVPLLVLTVLCAFASGFLIASVIAGEAVRWTLDAVRQALDEDVLPFRPPTGYHADFQNDGPDMVSALLVNDRTGDRTRVQVPPGGVLRIAAEEHLEWTA